ncbi:hypothetical protein C1H46_008176 [Malus baccata]|uniref:EF-hand domain-containing protein n=1 Tax=Malus baccata TaxID=106549 RepID=A0A540N5A7_MALBA|nr:hypothetical protein C1H46_008176 [Malus baccata]
MEIEALAVDQQQQMESNSRYLKSERDRAEDELDNDMHVTIDSSSAKGQVQKSDQGSQYTMGLVEEPRMGALGDKMFDLVTQQRKNRKLTFEDLVIAKGIYEKGMKDDTEEFIYQLLDVSEDGIVGR